MIIKVDAEARKLLLEMLDVVIRSQGAKAAQFGAQFPNLLQGFTKEEMELMQKRLPAPIEKEIPTKNVPELAEANPGIDEQIPQMEVVEKKTKK